MNKKLILVFSALAIVLGTGVLSMKNIYADEEKREFPPFMQGLIEKFGLNENEVKTFMEENRPERPDGFRGERGAGFEEKLENAVKTDTISEDQKNALLAKHDEMRANHAQAHEEYVVWAEEQGINLDELNLGRGMKHGMFFNYKAQEQK